MNLLNQIIDGTEHRRNTEARYRSANIGKQCSYLQNVVLNHHYRICRKSVTGRQQGFRKAKRLQMLTINKECHLLSLYKKMKPKYPGYKCFYLAHVMMFSVCAVASGQQIHSIEVLPTHTHSQSQTEVTL